MVVQHPQLERYAGIIYFYGKKPVLALEEDLVNGKAEKTRVIIMIRPVAEPNSN